MGKHVVRSRQKLVRRFNGRRWPALVGVVALVLSMLAMGTQVASGVQISGAITGVTITPPSQVGAALKINESWCVPDGTKAGDTFSQTLPTVLGGFPSGFNLTDAAGDVVATAAISTSIPAVVTFTMTAYAETHTSVCGTAFFSGYLNTPSDDGKTITLVVSNSDGTSFSTPVTFPAAVVIVGSTGHKAGAFADGGDQCRTAQTDCITWTVTSPVGPIDSGTITDKAPANEAFDCAKVATYLGDNTGAGGTFAHGVASSAGITITCTTTNLTATFGPLKTGQLINLVIPASVTTGVNGGNIDYSNTANISSKFNGVTTTTPSTAYIDSSSAGGDASGNQTPKITIVKWDTADGPAAGAFDNAPGKQLAVNTPTPITMTITNNGMETLANVVVSDVTTAGPALTGLSCDFSPLGGPSTGVTWKGPFAVGASFNCTGIVPAMGYGVQETDVATVAAVGQYDNVPVTSSNPWNGVTPTPVPSVTINKFDTADGPVGGAFDTAPGKAVAAGTPVPITMTITNNGQESLIKITVSDVTTAGPALTGLSCDFSALGGPSTGVTWAGPFAVGASFNCTGTVPAMSVGTQEADTATVTGVGAISAKPVSDTNPWNGVTPKPVPSIVIVKGDSNGNAADTAADAATLLNGTASLVYTITNNGNEALSNVTVSDQVVTNGTVTGLSCDFSPLGGPSTGTTWVGPLSAGASFTCTASLTNVVTGTDHEDIGTVTGTGVVSGTVVNSTNPYFADTVPKLVTLPGKSGTAPLALTGSDDLLLLWSGAGFLIAGLGLLLIGNRRRRTEA